MNQKTAKLLRTYARKINRKHVELRRWWEALNQKERAEQRQRMLAELPPRTGRARRPAAAPTA